MTLLTAVPGAGPAAPGPAAPGPAEPVLPGFALPPELEAGEPPEARGIPRDGVRMLVSRRATGEITHHRFGDLPGLLLPGDVLVVNTTATVPAAVASRQGPTVHFSTPLPDGDWLAELRAPAGRATRPWPGGSPGEVLGLAGGAALELLARVTGRLWRVKLSTAVVPYLLRHGKFIRYSYVSRDWPPEAYQTVFAATPGSAEMPSASRPFTHDLVTRLVTRGVVIAPITLHTGVSSLEGGEEPYPEPYDVPPVTARLVNAARRGGGRVIAGGTTVVRALETAARPDGVPAGQVIPSSGWTSQVVTPQTGLSVVDGLITGLHEPRSSHLLMLTAFAGPGLLRHCYRAAIEQGYLWHEFGDTHLLLP